MKTIERLKQLLAEATQGEWFDDGEDVFCDGTTIAYDGKPHNTKFIAATRNALPALLAVVEAAEELSDNDDTPEPNCSCHLCPPCNDCVTYAGKREIMATMKAALRALEGGE